MLLYTRSAGEQQLAISASIRLVVLDLDRLESLANRARALVGSQNAFSFRANRTLTIEKQKCV
jgi:hypothetical protein